jgi:hypothetical protein
MEIRVHCKKSGRYRVEPLEYTLAEDTVALEERSLHSNRCSWIAGLFPLHRPRISRADCGEAKSAYKRLACLT